MELGKKNVWPGEVQLIRSRLRQIAFMLRLSGEEAIEDSKYRILLIVGEEGGGRRGKKVGRWAQ